MRTVGVAAHAVTLVFVLAAGAGPSKPRKSRDGMTPIVLFPAYHLARALVAARR